MFMSFLSTNNIIRFCLQKVKEVSAETKKNETSKFDACFTGRQAERKSIKLLQK